MNKKVRQKMNLDRLKRIGEDVIKEEKLPQCYFKFRSPLAGMKTRHGTCQCGRYNQRYTILVYMTSAHYYEDLNGKYVGSNGMRLRRATVGKERSEDEVLNTFAHELAHLKYWKHGKEHKIYTEKILKIINQKLRR